MTDRINKAGYEKASEEVQLEDKRLSSPRAKVKAEVARLTTVVHIPMGPGELEYFAEQVADITVTEGRSKARRYLYEMDLSSKDVKCVMLKANELLSERTAETAEAGEHISVARHDHIYQKAMDMGDLNIALRAQAGLDRVSGVNTDSDESVAVRDGILKAMKEVYASDPRNDEKDIEES